MLVDQARIQVVAGRGGKGCVSFRREKYVPKGGPDGGDGGRGGSVWVKVDPHVRTLLDCRETRRYRAPDGGAGEGSRRTGRGGKDLTVWLPAGTVVRDGESGKQLADLTSAEDGLIVARGGRGGRGNARFATSTNQAPRRADPGEPGEQRWLDLELKLIADVGFVGLPNAGKSTLLKAVSRARPRVGAYPFTTRQPNLGLVRLDEERQFVAADLPGLIEGAHRGKGLGFEFLRHVERTRVLALVTDVTLPDPRAAVTLVLKELSEYSAELAAKPRVEVLSKADLLGPEERTKRRRSGALLVSAQTGEGIAELLEALWRLATASSAECETHDDG